MTKKHFSLLFLLIATVLNIVMTIVIIVALIVLAMLLIRVILRIDSPMVAMVAWMVCFIGGIVLDMFVYSKLMNYAITRFKLEDKLDPRMLGKRGAAAAAKEKASKPKTVLPKSVLGDNDEDTWGQTGPPQSGRLRREKRRIGSCRREMRYSNDGRRPPAASCKSRIRSAE